MAHHTLSVTAAVMSHKTIELAGARSRPRGNVQTAPTPIAVVALARLLKFAGTAGPVPHAMAAEVVGFAIRFETDTSLVKVASVVGFTPMADGRPSPYVETAPGAVIWLKPSSMIFGLLVAAARTSYAALAMAVLIVDCAFPKSTDYPTD